MGEQRKIVVRKARNLGFGVVATQEIGEGELIVEIKGKLVKMRTLYTIQVGRRAHLEPAAPGKYLNHSCNPNAYLSLVADKLFLIAKRKITEGEPVTYDYATSERKVLARADCQCNESNCRKILLGYEKMELEWKEKNKPYVLPHLLESEESLDPVD